MSNAIGEILQAFDLSPIREPHQILREQVLRWMRLDDIEARGALYTMLCDVNRTQRVQPALSFEDYYDFVIPYLEQCIESNPDGDWSESRYIAAHQFTVWIVGWWNDKDVPREKLSRVKDRIAALYKRGDDGVRDGVTNGLLEHLCENKELAEFFRDWENDPDLAPAYLAAMEWAETQPSPSS
jgi:hypothetical protein